MKKTDLATAYRNMKSPNKKTKSKALQIIKKHKNKKESA